MVCILSFYKWNWTNTDHYERNIIWIDLVLISTWFFLYVVLIVLNLSIETWKIFDDYEAMIGNIVNGKTGKNITDNVDRISGKQVIRYS